MNEATRRELRELADAVDGEANNAFDYSVTLMRRLDAIATRLRQLANKETP